MEIIPKSLETIFFGNNNAFSGGVRVIGEDHKVYNNYFEGLRYRKPNGAGSNTTGALNITNGKPDSALNEYYQVKNVHIVNNTMVDCDLGIRIGTVQNSSTTLAPQDIIVANNIMLNSSDSAFQEVTSPTGTSIYEGNITQNGDWDLTNGVDANQTVTSGLLVSGTEFYRLEIGSEAIDAGVGSYSFVTKDILYGNRDAAIDAGAEEFGAGGTVGPYKLADVGTTIGFGAFNPLSTSDLTIEKDAIQIYPIPADGQFTISKNNGSIGAIKIYDLQGKLLHTQTIELNTAKIDISNLSSGVYILKTTRTTVRFVIN